MIASDKKFLLGHKPMIKPSIIRQRLKDYNLMSLSRTLGIKYHKLYAFMRRTDEYISPELWGDLNNFLKPDAPNITLPRPVGKVRMSPCEMYQTYTYETPPEFKEGDFVWLAFSTPEKDYMVRKVIAKFPPKDGETWVGWWADSHSMPDQSYFFDHVFFTAHNVAAVEPQ